MVESCSQSLHLRSADSSRDHALGVLGQNNELLLNEFDALDLADDALLSEHRLDIVEALEVVDSIEAVEILEALEVAPVVERDVANARRWEGADADSVRGAGETRRCKAFRRLRTGPRQRGHPTHSGLA